MPNKDGTHLLLVSFPREKLVFTRCVERESSEKEDVCLVLGLFYFPGRYKG